MNALIIYTSQTGFTKKYAQWLAERTGGSLLELKEAQKKSPGFFDGYDAICYGGWAMAGSLVKAKWSWEKPPAGRISALPCSAQAAALKTIRI
jgi:hypothetical protein